MIVTHPGPVNRASWSRGAPQMVAVAVSDVRLCANGDASKSDLADYLGDRIGNVVDVV
jgi:hypothetical protein